MEQKHQNPSRKARQRLMLAALIPKVESIKNCDQIKGQSGIFVESNSTPLKPSSASLSCEVPLATSSLVGVFFQGLADLWIGQ